MLPPTQTLSNILLSGTTQCGFLHSSDTGENVRV